MLYAGIPYGRTINTFRRVITCLVVAAFTILFFFVVTILCVLFVPPAHGASPNDVAKAIAYVDRKSATSVAVLAEENTVYHVTVHELYLPTCGTDVLVNVSHLKIANPWNESIEKTAAIASVHITVGAGDDIRILMDLNADGAVDQALPMRKISPVDAQPEFDRVITCIAALP